MTNVVHDVELQIRLLVRYEILIVSIAGEFVMVHASYQSHLAGDVYFAPGCKPNDGIIWLLVVKAGISRVNLLQVSEHTVLAV